MRNRSTHFRDSQPTSHTPSDINAGQEVEPAKPAPLRLVSSHNRAARAGSKRPAQSTCYRRADEIPTAH